MNNLDKILDRITLDAEREIDSVNAEAQEKIDAIEEETKNKISDMKKRGETAAMREYQSILSRAEAAGAMSKREIMLRAKSKLIEKVYRDAENFIISLPSEKYASIMSSILADAVIDRINTVYEMTERYGEEEFASDSKLPFEVILSEKDKKEHSRDIISGAEQIIAERDVTVPKIKLSKDSADINGGFIVRFGESEINCSVSAMTEAVKEETYAKVAAVLFS